MALSCGKPYQETIVVTISLKSSPRIFGRAKFSLEITRLTNVPSKLIRESSEGSKQYSRAENSRKFRRNFFQAIFRRKSGEKHRNLFA